MFSTLDGTCEQRRIPASGMSPSPTGSKPPKRLRPRCAPRAGAVLITRSRVATPLRSPAYRTSSIQDFVEQQERYDRQQLTLRLV
jgi:hypothetical protein